MTPLDPAPRASVEHWICRRLQSPDLFVGITTPDERRERLRRLLIENGLEHAIAGRRDGHACETWSELFQRIYGMPLITAEHRAA